MVNTRTLFSAVALATCFYAIASYMKTNNLNTSDITFVDACWKMNAATNGGWNSTCTQAEVGETNWDTPIACFGDFAPEKYFFTPRQVMGLEGVGRRMKSDADLVSAVKTANTDRKKDICIVTPSIQSEFDAWMVQQKSAKRDNIILAGAALWLAVSCIVVQTGDCHDMGFYKACSTNPGFFVNWGADKAQCAGNEGHLCTDGRSWRHNWWRSHSRGGSNYLNNGCVTHDECLEFGPHTSSHDGCCDKALSGKAWDCVSAWSCGDGRFVSSIVSSIMAFQPNGSCPPPPPPPSGGW